MSVAWKGWDPRSLGENATAAWARNPGRTVDVTVDADAIEVEVETTCHDGGTHTATATIPRAVLVELLRRTSK